MINKGDFFDRCRFTWRNSFPDLWGKDRIRLVIDRFRENGLQDPTLDEFGNASGIVQGSSGNSTILVMAHADSVFSADTRHVLEVGSDFITGPGIADNAIGLAAVVAPSPNS